MLASAGLLGSALVFEPFLGFLGHRAPVLTLCQRQPACLKAAWVTSLMFPLCPSPAVVVVVVDFDMHFADCMF